MGCQCCSFIIKGYMVNHLTGMCRNKRKGIKEHKQNINNFKCNTYTDTPVSKHFSVNRHGMSQLMRLVVLEVAHISSRGSECIKSLLKSIRIKKLHSVHLFGINDRWSIEYFF
ncbi:hypothetical protein XELAEV_18015412mg [Xenopus laevis]|uniref:Uncharacterized protein n=1 Tax=Xenopus laevis TaxID=8355 RepID=A0A974DHZ2_XENLA|nr:hypothetical protein XELAEV_18015412mg [Xenopus laevis]